MGSPLQSLGYLSSGSEDTGKLPPSWLSKFELSPAPCLCPSEEWMHGGLLLGCGLGELGRKPQESEAGIYLGLH